jgi:hypothetical protein
VEKIDGMDYWGSGFASWFVEARSPTRGMLLAFFIPVDCLDVFDLAANA